MITWIFIAVVIATALFIYKFIHLKQIEVVKTQELLLGFIEQFEQQYQSLAMQIEEQKKELETKYDQLVLLLNTEESVQESTESNVNSANIESIKSKNEDMDPLFIKERYQPILAMYQEGRSIEEIARLVEKGKGEILLILELFGEKPN